MKSSRLDCQIAFQEIEAWTEILRPTSKYRRIKASFNSFIEHINLLVRYLCGSIKMFQIQMFSLKVFANDTARHAKARPEMRKLNRELKIFIYFCSFAVLNPLLQLFFLKPSQDSQSLWLENSKQEKQRKNKSSTDLLPPPASIKFQENSREGICLNIYQCSLPGKCLPRLFPDSPQSEHQTSK